MPGQMRLSATQKIRGLVKSGRADSAFALLKRFARRNSGGAQTNIALAYCAYHAGDLGSADDLVQVSIDSHGASIEAQLLSAAILSAGGRQDEAMKAALVALRSIAVRPERGDIVVVGTLEGAGLHVDADGNFCVEGGCNNLASALETGGRRVVLTWADLLPFPEWHSAMARIPTVVSAVSDPDSCADALETVARFAAATGAHVINPPDAVRRSRRDLLAAGLATPGVIVPRCERRRPVAGRVVDRPTLVRPVGSHNGHDLRLLQTGDNEMGLDAGLDYYFSDFIETAHRDGQRRKARVYWVLGEIFAEHLIVSPDRILHTAGVRQRMLARPELVAEELRFVENYRSLYPEIVPLMQETAAHTGLDIFMADIGLLEDGGVVLFEANSAMRIILERELVDEGAHLAEATRRLRYAVASGVGGRYD